MCERLERCDRPDHVERCLACEAVVSRAISLTHALPFARALYRAFRGLDCYRFGKYGTIL